MTTQRIENYAITNDLSNNEAKRRLRASGQRETEQGSQAPARGVPVPGTGKPKGQ